MNKQKETLEVENDLLMKIATLKAGRMIIDKRISGLVDEIIMVQLFSGEEAIERRTKLNKLVYAREKLTEQIHELTEEENNEKL